MQMQRLRLVGMRLGTLRGDLLAVIVLYQLSQFTGIIPIQIDQLIRLILFFFDQPHLLHEFIHTVDSDLLQNICDVHTILIGQVRRLADHHTVDQVIQHIQLIFLLYMYIRLLENICLFFTAKEILRWCRHHMEQILRTQLAGHHRIRIRNPVIKPLMHGRSGCFTF